MNNEPAIGSQWSFRGKTWTVSYLSFGRVILNREGSKDGWSIELESWPGDFLPA